MNLQGIAYVGIVFTLLALAAPILGAYIKRLLQTDVGSSWIGMVERRLYRLMHIDAERSMDWRAYLVAILVFNALGFAWLFSLLSMQGLLPYNPEGVAGLDPALAFNVAISFVTNTNWQSYAGETTLSPFVQMFGLGVQNFLSAATGIAVLAALTRGIAGSSTTELGNAWRDIIRITIGLLLPLSIVVAIALVSQGVIQTMHTTCDVTTITGDRLSIPTGPVASQVAIKQLGTNGGGYYNANSAHPFENPTSWSNLIETLALILIPASLCFSFGSMINHRKHGLALFTAMSIVLAGGIVGMLWSEHTAATELSVSHVAEGKEVRFNTAENVTWAAATTAASNGSVNNMHSSLSPLAGGIALLNMMLGEIIMGGVGSGLYGMMLFVLLTVFLTGLMVGRTPEYMGKRIDAVDVRWAIVAIVLPSAALLVGAALGLSTEVGRSSMLHDGPHGISEVLYATASAAGNNGSAFAGLNANTPFYNVLMGILMLLGRYGVIIPVVILAGRLGSRQRAAEHAGSFPTHTPLFIVLLIGTIVIVGALTFLPVLMLGPIAEHLQFVIGGL